MDRMSWTERKDNNFLELRDSYCRLIEDQGLQYDFVSYGQVEQGDLLKRGYRILILPRSSALSASEARAITDFVQQGGTLIVDGEAGTFDEHSRQLVKSSIADVLKGSVGRGRVVRLNAHDYFQQRVLGTGLQLQKTMRKLAADAAVHPVFSVVDAQGRPVAGVETHEFRNGATTIIGLLSNPPIEVDELGPLKVKVNERFDTPQAVRLIAPAQLYAYDVRRARSLGKVKQVALTIDPYEPTVLTFSPMPIPALRLAMPLRLGRGETGRIGLTLDGSSAASSLVFHIDVLNPAGELVPYYSGNVLARAGSTEKVLPLAKNEPTGTWTVQVRDLLSGQEKSARFEVF